MFSTISTRLAHEDARILAFGSVGATYTPTGDGAAYPARMLLVQNNTNAELWFSLDGIKNGFYLNANSSLWIDISCNQTHSRGLFLPAGDKVWVKQKGVPGAGEVIVNYFYGDD